MARRDFYHDIVKNALIKEGWTITHDPLDLIIGFSKLQVDLAGEKIFSAEKGMVKIAVEVKNFKGESDINELEKAMGQYALYRQEAMKVIQMNLLVFNADEEVVTQCIENHFTERS